MAELIIVLMPFIITALVFIFVISSIKRNAKAAAPKKQLTKNTSVPVNMRAEKNKKASSLSEMEDKSHDWLAQQIAYEWSAKIMVDEMFSLKREHAASCDAKSIRTTHAKNCDAGGVDTGQY